MCSTKCKGRTTKGTKVHEGGWDAQASLLLAKRFSHRPGPILEGGGEAEEIASGRGDRAAGEEAGKIEDVEAIV